MRHLILDQWSRRDSFLHDRDPRVKLIAALLLLIVVATTPPLIWWAFAEDAAILIAATFAARLPLLPVLERALIVLPFSAVFAISSWISGDTVRAIGLIEKAALSGWIALLLISTTPLPRLLKGAEWLGAPRILVLVIQFLYRYLFVLSDQSQRMRLAALCRSGKRPARSVLFQAAAGALGVLFATSYQRADAIHRAMESRGFGGSFPAAALRQPNVPDAIFLSIAVLPPIAARILAA